MTYEEALKWTNDSISKGRIQPEQENYSYMYRVQEALEKQIPKKPSYNGQNHFCLNCERVIFRHIGHTRNGAIDYCPFCGQAIDWSD